MNDTKERINKMLKKSEPILNAGKPKPMNSEEWFCQLSTEEKAKVFANATYSTALAPMEILALGKELEQKKWEMWLK